MKALGVSAAEIDIRPSAMQMLRDLGHPAADGEPQYDVTYENVQAGERTSHLFRLANHHGALVLGTGDLSELALGWSTYGVGDQMSHYNVNASVPKTLIRFLLRWAIGADLFGADADEVLTSVLETAISPELIPGGDDDGDGPHQDSEQTVGPYELQDFFLYYVLRFGYRPSKVAFLAEHAWGDRAARRLARPDPRRSPQRVHAGRDPPLAGGVPVPLLQDQPVQALGDAQRAEGRLGRLAVAALGLARAERQRGDRVADRAARRGPRGLTVSAHNAICGMPRDPDPLTLAEVVRRAVEIVDPDDDDAAVGDFQRAFEDADEPIRAVDDVESRVGEVLAELDPATNNGSLVDGRRGHDLPELPPRRVRRRAGQAAAPRRRGRVEGRPARARRRVARRPRHHSSDPPAGLTPRRRPASTGPASIRRPSGRGRGSGRRSGAAARPAR